MHLTNGNENSLLAVEIAITQFGNIEYRLTLIWDKSPFGPVFSQQIQSTPDNSNLQGKSKIVRVIASSKKIAGSKVKNSKK